MASFLLLIITANIAIAWWPSDVSKQQKRLDNVIDRLKEAYKKKLQPLEETFMFKRFNSFTTIDDLEFNDTKAMILLLGQYSTGKTSFIQFLLQSDFPGMEIGPEPTTDSFAAVMYGKQRQKTPGSVLVLDKTKPFRDLRESRNEFLQHFRASTLPNDVLKSITLIDTPGILSGKKQLVDRGYDFASVCSWFAEQADMIILFFDVYKMDILDEFQEIIKLIQKHHSKLFVVLNKADTITTPELIRVYGGLMWNLGRIINTPEVTRVYIGSFWNKGYTNDENHKLFDEHRHELFTKIQELARLDVMHRVEKMIQRVKWARTHARILCHLRGMMPSWSWSSSKSKEKELIDNLYAEIQKIQEKSEDPLESVDVKEMQKQLRKHGLKDFPTCDNAKNQFHALESI